MKKLLIVSAIVLGTFASISGASALDFGHGYPDWAKEVVNSGENN